MARGNVQLNNSSVSMRVNNATLDVIRRVARRVLARSAILCPVDTGRLRASGHMYVQDGTQGPRGVVEYPVDYALAVHDGTPPRIIRARKKKALRFRVGGKTVFAKSVHHPGTRGKPFLRMAAEEVATEEGLRLRTTAH